jgi:hypothetical protein
MRVTTALAAAQNATANTASTSQFPQAGRSNRVKTAAANSSCGTQNAIIAAGARARVAKAAETSRPSPSAAAEDSSMVRNVDP